jgi:hypothetical protein
MDASFTAILDSKMHAGFNEEFEFHGLDEAEMCDQKFYQSRANMVSCVHMSKMELDEPIKLLKGNKFPSFAIYFLDGRRWDMQIHWASPNNIIACFTPSHSNSSCILDFLGLGLLHAQYTIGAG